MTSPESTYHVTGGLSFAGRYGLHSVCLFVYISCTHLTPRTKRPRKARINVESWPRRT